ncbi:hypothetical protein [Sphaerisporangium sp. TRM90804]|uniref:hypothetical protein n=1 Tax=Sphaerisporangium sp. TRM90804 TaxID=3031113 RepID=UPI0024472A18|nr:hypothetical protein [Sphaerisporangium sp. TRM90804]MDH2427688.1 hypothetical protein [Sphaerisporangium sp. TRM90804]
MPSLRAPLTRTAVVLGLLAAPLIAPAAAHADASYTCSSGYAILSPIPILGPYEINATGCTGSGGYEPGVITIPSGTYDCGRVWLLPNGLLRGIQCE